jgi:hypothetical protein
MIIIDEQWIEQFLGGRHIKGGADTANGGRSRPAVIAGLPLKGGYIVFFWRPQRKPSGA